MLAHNQPGGEELAARLRFHCLNETNLRRVDLLVGLIMTPLSATRLLMHEEIATKMAKKAMAANLQQVCAF